MKKRTIAACAALAVSVSAFADGFDGVKLSGYLRAGLSATMDTNPVMNTKTWLGGIYFNGDSSKTRGRVNASFDGKSDAGKYGAFLRMEYTGADEAASKNWGYGGISYANAYAGFLDDKITVAAGKLKDNWIATSGFEGWSVLDKNSGAALTITPVKGLNLTGAAIIDYCINDEKKYDLNGYAFLGGAKYKTETFAASVSGAGYGLFTADFKYTGIKDVVISAEGKYETADGREKLGGQELLTDVWVQYSGIENLTLGVLSFQYFNTTTVKDDNDFIITVTPAAAYQVNKVVRLSLEGTYTQSAYDNAPDGFMTIVPAVRFSADKTASASIWASISTDYDQAKSCIGAGVIKEF